MIKVKIQIGDTSSEFAMPDYLVECMRLQIRETWSSGAWHPVHGDVFMLADLGNDEAVAECYLSALITNDLDDLGDIWNADRFLEELINDSKGGAV